MNGASLATWNVQLATMGEDPHALTIPSAEFPSKVQFVTAGEAPSLYIPPPFSVAELPLKVTFVNVGLLAL